MRFFALSCFVLYLSRLWLSSFINPHPDEAYYWYWAQNLSLNYFDHPPLIAWLIRGGEVFVNEILLNFAQSTESTKLFYQNLSLRLFPQLLSGFALPICCAFVIKKIQKKALSKTQSLSLLTSPLILFGPIIVTPDLAFFFFYCLCLGLNIDIASLRHKAMSPHQATPFQAKKCLALGLCLALAIYSKYTAFICFGLIAICLSGYKNFFLISLVASGALLPHLNKFFFQAGSGLPQSGFLFQIEHVLGAAANYKPLKAIGDLWLSQLAMWSPVVFIFSLIQIPKQVKYFFSQDKKHFTKNILLTWSFFPLLLFSLSALNKRPEANWPLAGAIAAVILFHAFCLRKKFLITNIYLNCLSICVLWFLASPPESEIGSKLNSSVKSSIQKRLNDFSDWDKLYWPIISQVRNQQYDVHIHSYQILSELLYLDRAFNKGLTSQLKIDKNSRRSQYNFDSKYQSTQENKKAFWLLLPGTENNNSDCKERQRMQRNEFQPKLYTLYFCEPNNG